MNNKNKKIILSSLMLLALLLLVVGVTFTALNFMNSSDANTINIGRISMSYSEPSNALELVNALPMSDEEGLAQTNYFEFTVSSNASTNENDDVGVTIPYEINLSDIAIDTDKTILPKDKIKVALTKVVDGKDEEIMQPTLINDLSTSTLNTGSLKVYDTKNIHKNNNGSITTRYRLRAWIDKDFELDNTKVYQYKFRVNVNSDTNSLSMLKVNRIMLEVWESNKTAMSNSKDSVLRLANEEDGRWVEVLDERTLTKDDRIRITFIYNNNIKGTVPVLSLKFGDNNATGTVSNGTIVDNKLSYEYVLTKEDNGKLNINDLTGGSIKDNADNTPVVLTTNEKESLKVNAETVIIPLILESIKTEVYKNNTWQEITTNTTVSKNDKVKITFNYNKEISGTAPTLSLNIGGATSKGVISTGVLGTKSLEYQYTVSKEDNGKITINNLTGGSIKDEDEQGLPLLTDTNKNAILLNVETSTFGQTLAKSVVTSGNGLYATTDTNDGEPSFYYKGQVENNYVSLPEKNGDTITNAIYRIVRINEDKTIRLIRQNGLSGNGQFNPNYKNYKYMYYSESNITNGMMKKINDWYASAIEGTTLDSKIVESNFCEQAKVKYTSSYKSEKATMAVKENYNPNLKCEVDGNGKGPLKLKVGMLTIDEAMLAGYSYIAINASSKFDEDYNNVPVYLHNNIHFWTMSPGGLNASSEATEWLVLKQGHFDARTTSSYYSVSGYTYRPVFSLSSDIEMSGKGTISEPFVPILQSN